jgi:hypothetical protein
MEEVAAAVASLFQTLYCLFLKIRGQECPA